MRISERPYTRRERLGWYRLEAASPREVGQRLQHPIDLVEGVVVAKAYAYGTTPPEPPEPFEHLDRVVVPVPREDAALAEHPGRLDRMLVTDTDPAGWGGRRPNRPA